VNIIGLEVSTSAAKCTLYSVAAGLVDTVEIPFDASVTDKRTQDPEGMVAVALRALKELVGRTTTDIAAIGLVGTWHSLLLLDEQARPLGPISMWADLSAASTVAELKKDGSLVRDYYQRTGCMTHAMYPSYKYYHLARTAPERVKRARFLSSQVEYLYFVLTGERAVSRCTASGTGLFNLHSLDWDDDLLSFVGVRRQQLAELKEVFHWGRLRAAVAQEVGLKEGTPVTVGAADGAMNQVAVGAAQGGMMSLSVGTSAAMRLVVDIPTLPQQPSTWCYYLYGGRYLAGAATNGANCVDWFLDQYGFRSHGYAELSRQAAQVDVQTAPLFLPFIYGERCPGWDEDRPGGFVGLKAQHGPAEMYYAILEGVLFNLYQCYGILTEVAETPERIFISGGIMHSSFWLQLACDLLARELWTTGTKHDSTTGAILVALASVVGESEITPAEKARVACRPSSLARTELLQARFRKYLAFYHATEGLW